MRTDEDTLEIRTGRRPLVDEPVGLVVAGARPGSAVAVRATVEVAGVVHQATATFDADEAGLVDTARQASRAGSYRGADPFGLWWSGQPQPVGMALTTISGALLTSPEMRALHDNVAPA